MPLDRFLGGGDFRQVQGELVQRFMLLDTRPRSGGAADVALDMDQAALNTGGGPALVEPFFFVTV